LCGPAFSAVISGHLRYHNRSKRNVIIGK
jgi:hypothetical protein